MKKYIIFITTFLILLGLFQFFSGILLTYMYTPDIEEAWKMSSSLPSETVMIGTSPWLMLIGTFVSASVAFLLAMKIKPKHHTNKK